MADYLLTEGEALGGHWAQSFIAVLHAFVFVIDSTSPELRYEFRGVLQCIMTAGCQYQRLVPYREKELDVDTLSRIYVFVVPGHSSRTLLHSNQ